MTYSLKKMVLVALASLGIVAFVSFAGLHTASARGVFGVGKKTALATTTLAFMTPGAATTTLSYDTFIDGLSTADSMDLLVRLTASSVSSVLGIRQEFSQDGIDWYQSSQPTIIQNATTTSTVDLSQVPSYSWKFASSTIGGVAVAANTDTRSIPVKSPTRFTRFIFTLTGANASIWAQVLPVKQNP